MNRFCRIIEVLGYQILFTRGSFGGGGCQCSTPGCPNAVPARYFLAVTSCDSDERPMQIMLCLEWWVSTTTEQLLELLTETDAADLLHIMQESNLAIITPEQAVERIAQFSLGLNNRVAA